MNTDKKPMSEKTCVMCGCTDDRACAGGCSWIHVFPHGDAGVCSSCGERFMTLQAKSLPETKHLYPLVLYFGNRREAAEFTKMVTSAHPNLTERKLR